MPIAIEVKTVRLISVHDQSTLRLEIPSITPGTYFIPGVSAAKEEFEKCVFSFPGREPVQYAQLREFEGKKYVEILVFEGKTPQYGTELDQKQDEQGRPMEPQLRRALLTVPAEDIANELERAARYFDQNIGVRALNKEVTLEDLQIAEEDNLKYLRALVTTTNRYLKFGSGNITEQAKIAAWKLHKLGLLNPLPEWATANPEGGVAKDTKNCEGCGAVIAKSAPWCSHCPAIYDWRKAVDLGKVVPRDVPPWKREEAGLDKYGSKKAEQLEEVREKVQQHFKDGTA